MLLIRCPYCNEAREEEEFAPAGEAFIARPAEPEALDDAAWADYLFMRRNPKGWHWEMWQHATGCRKFFVAKRHTLTYAIAGTWTLADARAARERDEHDAHDGSAT
jgi:sarcosine oxidase, subunit delta